MPRPGTWDISEVQDKCSRSQSFELPLACPRAACQEQKCPPEPLSPSDPQLQYGRESHRRSFIQGVLLLYKAVFKLLWDFDAAGAVLNVTMDPSRCTVGGLA